MASEEFAGSCLCGSVQYRIRGSVRAFYHCHCGRCRKANGTGHASNVILSLEAAEWLAGEDRLREFRVPDAKRFRNVFCADCGSPMPRVAAEKNFAVIPAGTLDSAPQLEATDRIFCASRSDWSCAPGDIASWDEYPQRD